MSHNDTKQKRNTFSYMKNDKSGGQIYVEHKNKLESHT